jgi:hypothetical protein
MQCLFQEVLIMPAGTKVQGWPVNCAGTLRCYNATVTASSKAKVLAIEREPLLSLMQKDPSLGLTIMQNIASIISSRLRNLELEMVGMVQRRR